MQVNFSAVLDLTVSTEMLQSVFLVVVVLMCVCVCVCVCVCALLWLFYVFVFFNQVSALF